jgi:multiple sugar transport system substrate-binding protein
MTWSDPRGLDPMLATAARWHELHPAVEVIWEARSLQDFESYPVAELAARFDLMVIDHPHVGQVVREGVLVPLDRHLPAETIAVLERQSVGPSLASYRWEGHLWALPVDASTQVQAIRPTRAGRIDSSAARGAGMRSRRSGATGGCSGRCARRTR